MKFTTILCIGVMVFIILFAISIFYTSTGVIHTNASIINHNVYHGGDLQVYENLTISYHGIVSTYIINCDRFVNSTTIPIIYYPKGEFDRPIIQLDLYAYTGCEIQ